MSDPVIPAEAVAAAEKASYMWESDVPIEQIRTAILEAAAPHIARAAGIAELGRMADQLDAHSEKLTESPQADYESQVRVENLALGYEGAGVLLRNRIVELEAHDD